MSTATKESRRRRLGELGTLQRAAPIRYAASVAFVALASILQQLVLPPPSVASFLFFGAGVSCAAWFGGFGPGVLATVLSALIGNILFTEPIGGLTLSGQMGLATLLVLPVGCLIALIGGSLRKAVVQVRAHLEALKVSEERLRLAQAVSGVGIYDHDLTTGLIELDDRTSDIFGLPSSPHVQPWDELMRSIHSEDRGLVLASLERADATGADYSLEYRVHQGGAPRWIRAAGRVTIKDGRPVRRVGTVEDVTEPKEAAESLRAANLKLAEADQRKNEFLGMLSHELRNPLAPIRNSLFILERTSPGGEQARRAHVVIRRQVDLLAHLVDDLLDVTRITHGKIRLQLKNLDLVEVVRTTVEDHRALVEAEHRLVVNLPSEKIPMEGDPVRLSQAIGNLLSNASKFTPGGGSIAVSVRLGQGRATVEVSDSGIGMDAGTVRTIFEPFAQADRSLDRSRGGLGLGLALVKGVAHLHGGEVAAESGGPGKGARFSLVLPIWKTEAGSPSRAQPRPAVPGRRILIIDDNRDAADTLSEALSLAGHHPVVAQNGEEGVAKAREFLPEVVLCDIGLPGEMDGYFVARTLRKDSRTASAFLIAMTGYALPDDERRALDAGFDAHLAKPADVDALDRRLAQLDPRM